MKRGRKPTIKNVSRAVAEACQAICAKGERPTVRSVRAWLIKHEGGAPNNTEVAPLVKAWKSARADSKAVEAVCLAYERLDAEQQDAVKRVINNETTFS